MDDQRHVALPKLYGAPAYARPPVVPVNPVPRPIDPDDLPLVAQTIADDPPPIAQMTPDDLQRLQGLEVGIAGTEPTGVFPEPTSLATPPPAENQPRPFSIRDVVQRIRSSRP